MHICAPVHKERALRWPRSVVSAGVAPRQLTPSRETPPPAVINGVIAVPMMVVIMLLAARRKVMGQFVVSRGLGLLGWVATAAMAAATLGMFLTWGK